MKLFVKKHVLQGSKYGSDCDLIFGFGLELATVFFCFIHWFNEFFQFLVLSRKRLFERVLLSTFYANLERPSTERRILLLLPWYIVDMWGPLIRTVMILLVGSVRFIYLILQWFDDLFDNLLFLNSSVIRQQSESQNGCFNKTKHVKFSKKRTFLTP